MLGNFSFGDYFKAEAVEMAWELATRELGIPAERIWVSVYEGDADAAALWEARAGVPAARIQRLGAADNFWASGPTGAPLARPPPGARGRRQRAPRRLLPHLWQPCGDQAEVGPCGCGSLSHARRDQAHSVSRNLGRPVLAGNLACVATLA
jgi:hypothetical protein